MEDLAIVYPVFNSASYIIDNSVINSVEENIVAEQKYEFNAEYMDVYSSGKKNSGDIELSEQYGYQKAKIAGITITNYANNRNIDYTSLMSKSVKLSRKVDKVLLYTTHTSESYVQSENYVFSYSENMRTKEANYNMLGVATILQKALIENGLSVVFDTTPHDYTSYDNAYTNSRQTVKNAINANGVFGISIDVHRDAYGDLYDSPTAIINGKEVAQIMIVVGIGTSGYENKYWEYNLALAMQIMKLGEEMYPGLFRPLLIRSSRYNQDLNEGAFLIEVGATGNTHEEVFYAARCFGNILSNFYGN